MLAQNGRRSRTDAQVRCVLDEPRADIDDFCDRHWKPNALGNSRRQQLVGEHSNVLRIVLKLDDVIMTVVGEHQMALCAPAHGAQMLFRLDHGSGR